MREEGEMKIRLLNDSSVSDASSFREDCPDLDVDMVDPLRPVRTVEIVKNPGESLGECAFSLFELLMYLQITVPNGTYY